MTIFSLVRRRIPFFVALLLAVEFLDEFVFGAGEAALPLIRRDLALDYAAIGLLLGLPKIASLFVEPLVGILGDVGNRRFLVLAGGIAFALACALVAVSGNFLFLLIAFIIFYPASGAFVSLSQASLMDLDPARHEQNMARWTFAGSVGVVAGPLVLSGVLALGGGWRSLYTAFAVLAVLLVLAAARFAFPNNATEESTLASGLMDALRALQRIEVLRWLVLLEFSDLMLDILLGFIAIYFVDVVGVSEMEAALAVAVWSGAALAGDFLVIPLLERVRGLSYLRLSAAVEAVLFAAMLIVPGVWPKLILLALVALANPGWYSVLKGQLYSAMPGQSGTVMAVSNVSGLLGALFPLMLGVIAERFGLGTMMWVLLLGPLALLVGIPRRPAAI